MIFSNTAMMVDNAAKFIKMKNKDPQIRPLLMALKILGSVTNTRPGPLPASTPKDIQAGKMIKPAMIATNVSRIMIFKDSPLNERFLSI